MGYIYKITNNINRKIYIGKTTRTIKERWKEHLKKINYEKNKFYNALNKYGIDNFIIEEIEECDDDILNEQEIYWINFYNSYENGYNSTGGGDGGIKITSTKVKQIIELYQLGYCIRDICIILDSSIETVSFYLKQELKLTDEEIKNNGYKIRGKKQNKSVVQLSLNGIEINTFASMTEAQEKTGIWRNHIGDVCNGKRQTTGGFKWKFL